jgi:uncharacterized protein YuzE
VIRVFQFDDPPSMYIDLSTEDSPWTAIELAPGLLIHASETGVVVGIEVLGRGDPRLVTLAESGSLYVDLSEGEVVPVLMAELADDLWVHYGEGDQLSGLEVRRLAA